METEIGTPKKRGGWKLKPRTIEQCKAISDRQKSKWASGTRKPTPKSAYEKSSATKLRKFADGTHGKMSIEDRKRIATLGASAFMANPALVEAAKNHLRALAKARIGGKNPPGLSERGERHWKAKYWKIRTPTGQYLEGVNLNEIVRKNEHLFDPDDVVWKKSQCRASRGLGMMFTNYKCCSWKGWTAMNSWERNDYLARNPSKTEETE